MIDLRPGFLSTLLATIAVLSASGNEDEKEPEARLTWNNGESLPGEVVGATEKELTWKTPLFAKPVPLSLAALRSVTGAAKAVEPGGSMSVNLRDGSRIYGDLAGIDGEWVTLTSERHGELRIRQNAINVIHRRKGEEVLWCGPFGEAGWEYSSSKITAGQRMQNGPSGSLQSFAWRQRSTLPLELPEQVEIEFHLRSSARPEFEIMAAADKRAITLTTWKDELVLRQGNHFVSLKSLKSSDRELKLRLFWDRKSGSGMVSTADGELLGKWQSAPDEPEEAPAEEASEAGGGGGEIQIRGNMINRIVGGLMIFPGMGGRESSSKTKKNPPPDGVSLTNRGQDLQIRFLRVREWDGGYPERSLSNPFRTRLELAGGAAIEGQVVRGTEQQLVFREGEGGAERAISVDEVESIFFPAEPIETEGAPSDELRFADGTWLRGRLLGIADGAARVRSSFSDAPVIAKFDGLRELNLRAAAAEAKDDGKEPVPLAKQDRLVTGKTTIHGSWVPAAGPRIQWKLDGAAGPVEVASDAEMELTRVPAEDGEWPRSPALFHLTNGQIAPGELVAIDGGKAETIKYRSELFQSGSFSRGDLHAIQFRGPEVDPEGFNDPSWQIVRGGEKGVDLEKGVLSIEPGGSWGHPSILVGDEIHFTMEPSGYSTLRVRLFTDGIDTNSAGTHILLAHYGSEIYCGLEETPGQLNQRRDISVGSNKPAKVRISWDAAAVKVSINGMMAIRVPKGPKAKRSGLGLVFEPADLWGNGERKIKLSKFLLKAAPGVTWVPGVNPVAKERALFLPRFRKEDPPQHMLLAPNGDVLRGTIVAAAQDRIGFRSGLEELSIPRDRVAAAIWLKAPPPERKGEDDEENEDAEETGEKAEEKKEEPAEAGKAKGPEPTHWLLLTSGARLGLAIESFGPEVITGHSPGLGKCQIPAEHVHLILSAEPDASPASLAFSNWQLKKAPEPLSEPGGGENSPMVGNDAPEIDLAMLDGGRFRLSEEKGKVIVLDFWATWCGPCVRAIPEMIQEFSSFDRSRMRFIGVNQAEQPALIEPFLEQRGWNPFEVALDVETLVGRAYGVEGIPHTVIIDHEGKVAWVSTGFKPDGAIEAADVVRELLGEAPDDRTSRIMEAKDIRDLGIKAGRFDEFVAAMLVDFVGKDREKALEVFEKAVEIVNTSRERDAWKFKYADQAKSFAGDVVIHLRNKVDPVSWIAFQADLMRSEKIPPFEVLRIWGENAVIDGFVAAEEDSDKPRQPIETSLRILGECAGSEELLPFIAPMLVKVIQRYNGDTVLHLHSTIEGMAAKPAPAYLKEIAMATDLALRMRESFRGRFYPPEVTAHYLAALKNESVPLNVRIRLADFLASGAVPPPNRELAFAGAEAIAEGWSGEAPVFQFWAIRPLQAFMREERDAAWKQTAKALGEGFRKRYLGETSPVGVPNLPDDTLLSLMMDAYLSIGDVESTKTVFERYRKRFVDYEMPIIHLVRAGEVEEAAELLKNQWSRIGRKWTTEAVYDELLAENAEAFLDRIDPSDLRVFAEALIANAKDPVRSTRVPRAPVPHGGPRSLRLQAAAGNYGEATFSNAVRKRMVLGILANDIAAARIVAEDLREEAEEIDIDDALDARSYSTVIREDVFTKPDLAVFQGALLLDMADGKVEEVNQKLDSVAAASSEKPLHKGVFVEKIFKMPVQAILGSPDPAKTAEALIPVCRRMALRIEGLDPKKTWVGQRGEPWAQLSFALAEAGKLDELLPWLRGTCEGDVLTDNLQRWKGATGAFFQLISEKLEGAPVEDRVAYLKQVLAGNWLVEEFTNYTNGSFRNVVGQGILSPAGFLEHGEAIAAAAPREGHAWNDLAYVHSRNGDLDGALKFWEKAAKAMEAAELPQDAGRYRVNAARTQYQRLQTEAALKTIEGIDGETYQGNDLKFLKKQLEAEGFLVAAAEEWTEMAQTAFTAGPPAVKKPSSSAAKPANRFETEPDPFGVPEKKAKPKPRPADGGDEPDPFGAPPKKAPKAQAEPPAEGTEPDPFGE